MEDRTITISGFSKTYAMTGWRLGYTVARRHLAAKMAILNDLINVCAPSPLQYGVVAAFDLPPSYYTTMRADYQKKRDMTVEACREAGFTLTRRRGPTTCCATSGISASRTTRRRPG